MPLTVLAETIVKLEPASLGPAKASPPNTAWMGNAVFRTTTYCAAANGVPAATPREIAAQERASAESQSARVATALSSFLPLRLQASQARAQRSLFLPQPLHQAASALTDLAVVPTNSSVRAQPLATAVALPASAAELLATVKQAARLPSARARTPVYPPTAPAEVPTNTNAKDPGSAIAAALRVTAAHPPATAQRGARLGLGPARLPTSRQMGLAEERKDMCAKILPSATAVVLLGTVDRRQHIALRAVRQHLVHAHLLTSHLTVRVVGRRSTSVKARRTATAAVPVDTVESQQIIVVRAVNLGSVLAPRLLRRPKHPPRLASRRMVLVAAQRD
jgi:hypothetical protein